MGIMVIISETSGIASIFILLNMADHDDEGVLSYNGRNAEMSMCIWRKDEVHWIWRILNELFIFTMY
ncbi:hypothetical protein DQG23_31780 [Paenibacillus contaminans]|uniref:Uncharacterized protein n=1 Tax=Paenibacillus contaminans TaxID=450362 RepID=A0A329M3D0_9BACL|nr:hypothetical protein DQG23_31780 [Paenibacillus contaminans]